MPRGAPDARSSTVGLMAWTSVFILLLLNILSHVDRTVIALLVDPIKASLDITDVQFSLLQGLAFTLFYSFASLPMGWLADRFSRHWVIFFGVSGWSVCTALCGLVTNFWQMFTARVGVGAGEATLYPASYALIGDLFPPQRVATAAGILAAGGAIGSALALAIGGMTIRLAESFPPPFGLEVWQVVFMAVGLPGLLLAPLVWLIPRNKEAKSKVASPAAAAGYLPWLRRNGWFLVPLFVATGFSAVQGVGAGVWMPSYLIRHFGMEASNAGVLLGLVNGIPGTIGFIGGGVVIDYLITRGVRFPHMRYFVAAAILQSLAGFMTYQFPDSLAMTMVFWGLVGLFLPVTGPVIGFVQQTTPAGYRARTTAILFIIMYFIGMALGPLVVALIAERVMGGPEHVGTGLMMVFVIFGPLTVISFLISHHFQRRILGDKAGFVQAP